MELDGHASTRTEGETGCNDTNAATKNCRGEYTFSGARVGMETK